MKLTLLIPAKPDVERDSVAAAWERRGGTVLRLDRFWDPPAVDAAQVRVYGNDTFCLVLQQKLGLELVAPPDDLILAAPASCTRRPLSRATLGAAPALAYPLFAKPMTPKLFGARVYGSSVELAAESAGLPAETAILVSEVVSLAAEARCFVLDGRLLDCAIYEGAGDAGAAAACAREIMAAIDGPRTYVVDVGLISGRGWAVIEFNAAWGAGLNGCDPGRILPAIANASGPAAAAGRPAATQGRVALVRIKGWRPGLEKIALTRALQSAADLGLAAAKACTDRVLAGVVVEVPVRDEEAARALTQELQRLGAVAEADDDPA